MADKSAAVESTFAFLSTKQNAIFRLDKYFGSSEDATTGEWWTDPLDSRFQAILKLRRSQTIIYNHGTPITSYSMTTYGTTSLWWLIVVCSGYLHASQIPSNTHIQIPSADDITSTLKKLAEVEVSRIITF